jgi:predicted secreted protein
MSRIVILALLMLTATSRMAAANDATAVNVLGFSPDGRYFAFEEFGAADASELKYAAVVMQYFTQGFEGPDRRFIAVTAKIPR